MAAILLLVAASAGAGFIGGAFAAHFPGSSAEWAAWVQAIGAIAAVIAAFLLASDGARKAARADRLAQKRAIDAACKLSLDVLALIGDVSGGRGVYDVGAENYLSYQMRISEEIRTALTALPVDKLIACDALKQVHDIRTNIAHLTEVLRYWSIQAPTQGSRNQITFIEKKIRDAHNELMAILWN